MAYTLSGLILLAFIGYFLIGFFKPAKAKHYFRVGALGAVIALVPVVFFAPDSAAPDPSSSLALPDYSVISDEAIGRMKRTVEVILPERVNRDQIDAIARDIKRAELTQYERIFISYQIQGELTDDIGMSYAISHFDPDLTIKINGLSADELAIAWSKVDEMRRQSDRGDMQFWYDYGFPGTIRIVELDGTAVRLHRVYPHVATDEAEWAPRSVTAIAVQEGNTVKLSDPCCEGEWLRLMPDGMLRFQSDLGTDIWLPPAKRGDIALRP